MPEPANQLRALLDPLCSTDEDREVLAGLCERAKSFTDNRADFVFEDEEEDDDEDGWDFGYERGRVVAYHPSVPKSFSEIAATVGELVMDGGGRHRPGRPRRRTGSRRLR